MILNLDSVHAKINRVREHASTLEKEIRAWHTPNPNKIGHAASEDFRVHRFILERSTEPDLERWSLIFGDAIHNLRSALDHLVYAIAISESSQDPPPDENSLAFPVCDTVEGLHGTSKKRGAIWRIEKLSGSVKAAIERVQPFNRTNPITPPYLGIIRDLDDKDKHRLLGVAEQGINEGELGVDGVHSSCNEIRFFYPSTGTVDNGAEVGRIEFDVPNPELDTKKTRFRLVVAVWHGKRDVTSHPGSDYSEIVGFLNDLILEVEYVIESVAKAVIPSALPLISNRTPEPSVQVTFARIPTGVSCKGCGAALVLGSPFRPIGILHKGSSMPFPVLPESSFQCPFCGQSHEYEQSDVRTFPLSDSLLRALRRE